MQHVEWWSFPVSGYRILCLNDTVTTDKNNAWMWYAIGAMPWCIVFIKHSKSQHMFCVLVLQQRIPKVFAAVKIGQNFPTVIRHCGHVDP